MIHLIEQMNSILSDWRTQFDPLQAVPLSFKMNDRGEIFFEQKQLFLFPDIVLEEAQFEADTIRFSFGAYRYLEISIHWPEDALQYVERISWGYSAP